MSGAPSAESERAALVGPDRRSNRVSGRVSRSVTDRRASDRSAAWDGAMLAISIVLPAWLAILHAANVADAAHDEALVRTVALGWTGPFRALDAIIAAPLSVFPLGTHAFRASLAPVFMSGIAGGLLFALTRSLLGKTAASPRLGAAIAAIASTTATLSVGFQLESASPGGAALGGVLVFLAPWIMQQTQWVHTARIGLVSAALALALSYVPPVGASASLGVLAIVIARRERPEAKPVRLAAIFGALVGLTPFALALAAMGLRPGVALSAGLFASPFGEVGESAPGSPYAFLRDDVGLLGCALAAASAIVLVRSPRARPFALSMIAIALAGLGAVALGAPAGDTRYGGAALASIGAISALSAVAMQGGVLAVAAARVPFAQASAVMIVILEATFPVRAADEAIGRCDDRARGAAATWNDAAWASFPAGALVMTSDPRLHTRLLAARAAGELRGDLAVVPAFDPRGPLAARELLREPKLAPFFRDLALNGAPDEWSLSSLAASRPLLSTFEPTWERALSRHMTPSGLFLRYEPEPRGMSDRRNALEELAADRDRLARDIVATRDPELLAVTTALLRGRALSFASTGDRDLVGRALEDVRVFSPKDAVAAELSRRLANAHGPVNLKGLSPTL